MVKQCIDLNLPNELNELVKDAIDLVKVYGPNSRVKENAELFIKAHIVPINAFVDFNNNAIKIKINTEGKLIIKGTLLILSDGKPCKLRVRKEHLTLLSIYLNHELRLLMMFRGYLICGDVLNYLIWAYDRAANNNLINKLINHGIKERAIIKALNELFNLVACNLLNYSMGDQMYVNHNIPEEILRDINNLILILLRVSDDCTYVGLY